MGEPMGQPRGSADDGAYSASYDDVPPPPESEDFGAGQGSAGPSSSSGGSGGFGRGRRGNGDRDRGERATRGVDFGRQPPHNIEAEQGVLGGMLLSKDAIADVVEEIQPGDFYKPSHQSIYDVILDLYARGEPADAVTVSAELDRRGELRRVGGAPYLHTLISTVPTAANAGYYAEIVAEKAVLRRLVDAGTRIVQYGYSGSEGADVTEVVGIDLSPGMAVAFLFTFALVFTRSAMSDILDIQSDKLLGRETIPVMIGKEKTQGVLKAILLISFLP